MLHGTFGGRFGDTSHRPYIEAHLDIPALGLRGKISFLVDTGADTTCLSSTDAMLLGVDFDTLGEPSECGGIGGQVKEYPVGAVLVFSAPNVAVHAYQIVLGILAPDSCGPDIPSLLGRDILDRWRMTYDRTKSELAFEVLSADLSVPLS